MSDDARPATGAVLCALADIADPGAKGFTFAAAAPGGREFQGFLVRHGEGVVGYVDACPHTGGPLPAAPDRYLDRKGEWILCFTHGAMFRVDDGVCVAGPCVRRALRPWPVRVEDGWVVAA